MKLVHSPRTHLLLAAVVGLIPFGRTHAAEILHPGDAIAVIGDSITEQKRYSVFIEDYLMMCEPTASLITYQFGYSGEATTGLLKRLDATVLPFHPTVATTLYGMNDGGYLPSNPATLATFRENTEAIVRKLQAGGVRTVIVGSPGAVDTEKFKTMRYAKCAPEVYNQTLADLSQAAHEAADHTGAVFVDVHTPMMTAMEKAKAKYGADYALAPDGVHPAYNGHLIMAYALLKALGCKGDIGTLTLDAKTGAATATAGHSIIASTPLRVEIESSRYPFCFVDNPSTHDSSRAILEFLPFNNDLNRFLLVVKKLSAPRAKIKWGQAEKTFTAEELAAGINLAAEFMDNPFKDVFSRVEAALRTQQEYETPATKFLMSSLHDWQTTLPEEQTDLTRLQNAVVEKSRRLAAEARRAIIPVRHTVELTPQF